MSARPLAVFLLLVAASIYGGVAVPIRRSAIAVRDSDRRLRDERREAQSRLTALQHQRGAYERAVAALSAASAHGGDPSRALRASVVESLGGTSLSGVRLVVQPGRPPVGAHVRLSAEGAFPEVVRLCGHVVRPGTGVILERVRLRPSPTGILLELEGQNLGVRR